MSVRRSARHKKAQAKYIPGPLLSDYINYYSPNISFRRQSDYIKEAKQYSPQLMGLHNQGYNPYCSLFSITTAVEISQRRKWSADEKEARTEFCMNYGLQAGDALERTLSYYDKAFPNDMTYRPAYNMASAGHYTGGKNDPQKTYGSPNDLIKGLQENVVICCVSCADVESQYRLHGKKCKDADWHSITCVAYILLNNRPTFVFKDTNRRTKNTSSIVFVPADEFVDAELLLQQRIGGKSYAGVEEYNGLRRWITNNNIFVITEMFIVNAKQPQVGVKIKL